MILCLCRGTSERQVRKAVDDGATSLEHLQAAGIGDRCGACNATLCNLLAEREAEESCGQSCSACPNQRRLAS